MFPLRNLCLNIGQSTTVAAILDCARSNFSAFQCSALAPLEWKPKVSILAIIQLPGHDIANSCAFHSRCTTQPLGSQGCAESINNWLTRYELSLRLFSWLLVLLFSSNTLDEPLLPSSSAPWTPWCYPGENTGGFCAEELLGALARQISERDERPPPVF